jgi:hypothetical protein
VVPGTLGDALELLVGADLKVLEGVGEGGQLARRVGVALEERTPIERAEAQAGILELAGLAAQGVQAPSPARRATRSSSS